MGYHIGDKMKANVELYFEKTFDFLPELAVFATSYLVKKSFTRHTTPPENIQNSIRFFFHNVFESKNKSKQSQGVSQRPYVRVFPSSQPHESRFKKNKQVNGIAVFVDSEYLKKILGNDAAHFQYLFDNDNNFLIEEIMTDDILRTANELIGELDAGILKDFFYRLKVMELLYNLFLSLKKRANSKPLKLSQSDIAAIYKVRDALILSLQKSPSMEALKKIAGLNENKMRQLFIQIFGMGIYDYFQYQRITEAARLLREEQLSVSEVGYQLGFENLSHFTRTFEKIIGMKPKKYAMKLG
ncbi:MAG: AraC family transcriptional regulator [Pseudopedobacter saltans]|uniref:AraC family transcriptional regulator n=1 Tax=Pseudopedobacter saltans TaxID=151895 RepID=A0A2W5F386_9SPHI|nr:MAG: AraC family transcriptional regulator [Pseudopedobacter saltans]